jgi:hypothetical protein
MKRYGKIHVVEVELGQGSPLDNLRRRDMSID